MQKLEIGAEDEIERSILASMRELITGIPLEVITKILYTTKASLQFTEREAKDGLLKLGGIEDKYE